MNVDHLMSITIPKIWIISPGRDTQFVFEIPSLNNRTVSVREYRISMLGHYLISPEPLNVKRWLAGCEIHWRHSAWTRIKNQFIRRLQSKHLKGPKISVLRPDFPNYKIITTDEKLGCHLKNIQDKLRSHDSFHNTLNNIDISRIADVVAIIEDDAGHSSQLGIIGDVMQKFDFVRNHACKKIDIKINCAQFADGLFEMSNFNFSNYTPEVAFRLLRFVENDVLKACVLNKDNTIAFWLDNPELINYLQLIELSVQKNHHMHDSLCRCIKGDVTPLRLMLNTTLEIDYSQAPLPDIFKEVIGENSQADHVGRLIKKHLNHYQLSVSLNTCSHQMADGSGLHTDISVLQNLRALEPVKQELPALYAEITRRTNRSEAGSFYLLDTIRGANHET